MQSEDRLRRKLAKKDKKQGWKMEREDGKWTGKGLTQVKFYHIIPLLSFIALMSYVK